MFQSQDHLQGAICSLLKSHIKTTHQLISITLTGCCGSMSYCVENEPAYGYSSCLTKLTSEWF